MQLSPPKVLTFKSTTGEVGSWDIAQSVKVTGQEDYVDNPGGSRSVVITHTPVGPGGYGYTQRRDITVTVKDQDSEVAGITVVKNSHGTVDEGKTNHFTFKLSTAPEIGKEVAVRVTSDSSKATVKPSSLSFTHANWDMVQTVYVTGVSGSHEGVDTEITLTASGRNYGAQTKKVLFTVVRSREAELRVAPQQLEVTESGAATYTVELNTDPGQTVTVSISSGSILTVSPKSLTFTSGDGGN